MDASKMSFLQTVLKYSTSNSVAEIPKQEEDELHSGQPQPMDTEVI